MGTVVEMNEESPDFRPHHVNRKEWNVDEAIQSPNLPPMALGGRIAPV